MKDLARQNATPANASQPRRRAGWSALLAALLFGWSVGAETTLSALGAGDKAGLSELFRLKCEFGDRIYPGLAEVEIGIILFDDRDDFFIGTAHPGHGWEVVAGDEVGGRPYYRRAHEKRLQAFVVPIGRRWAASIPTLAKMNSGPSPIKITSDFWVALAFHEMFHAFQAELAPERFQAALAVYGHEPGYPFQNKEFAEAWDAEGGNLYAALKATDEASALLSAREFLRIRGERRSRTGLAVELLAFERDLEWLEGLAKYAEMLIYEMAATAGGRDPLVQYRPNFFIFQSDLARLGKALGRQDGDLRFYLSGMAQARLLDRLAPDWKTRGPLKDVFVEDLLASVVGPTN